MKESLDEKIEKKERPWGGLRPMKDYDYDLAVIGGGSGGATAAATAVAIGIKKVLLIEKGALGGTCTNTGCVPSKANLHAALLARQGQKVSSYGLGKCEPGFNFGAVKAHQARIVTEFRDDGEKALARLGIEVMRAPATFTGPNSLTVKEREITAKNIVIAAGAEPVIPPIEGLKDTPFMISQTALADSVLPTSMIIIGGSYIGLEFATLYNSLGVQTTIVEAADRLASIEDRDISTFIAQALADRGVESTTGVLISKVEFARGRFLVSGEKEGREMNFSGQRLLVATGRRPSLSGLNLDAAGIKYGKKGIEVNEHLQTSAPSVYAAGDCVPSPQLEHVAVYEGWLAASNIFSAAKEKADYRVIPHVMFTEPEIAAVGLTEEQARAQTDVATVTLPYRGIPAARIKEDTEGLIKLVADSRDGRLLGVHIGGNSAGELMHLGALAMKANLSVDDIGQVVSAYPTLAQGFFQACETLTQGLAENEAA
jgi:mercuric reductase